MLVAAVIAIILIYCAWCDWLDYKRAALADCDCNDAGEDNNP